MKVRQALKISPVKQAISWEKTGPMVIVTQMGEGGCCVSAIAGSSVFFQAEVADEQTIEQTLREHPRLSGVSFEPVYTSYTASPFRTSMWAKRAHRTPRQRNASGQVLLQWLHLLEPTRRPKAPQLTSLAGLERIQLPEQQSHSPSFLTPPRISRRTALLGLGTFTLVIA
jgi:hypothetical protein